MIPSCSVVITAIAAAAVAVIAEPVEKGPEAIRGASGHPTVGKNKDEKHEHTKKSVKNKKNRSPPPNHTSLKQATTVIYYQPEHLKPSYPSSNNFICPALS